VVFHPGRPAADMFDSSTTSDQAFLLVTVPMAATFPGRSAIAGFKASTVENVVAVITRAVTYRSQT
jgi:hypothetical protein